MQVLLTVASLDAGYGGPTGKAACLASSLRELGVQVSVAGVGAGREVDVLPVRPLARFHGTPIPTRLAALWRAARGVDVVHVLGYRDPVGTTASLSAQAAGIPCVLEPCGMHRIRLRSLRLKRAFDAGPGRLVVGAAARVVATSGLEARELAEDGIAPSRIVLRANGLALDGLVPLPTPGAFRRRHGIPFETPLVLQLGRIAAKKGLLEFVGAVARLPGVHGVVAGPTDGDGTLPQLLAERRKLEVEGRVHVLPQGLWGSEKAEVLADADAFALASATENFGNAAAEGAAVGLPVAVSEACGVAELLDPACSRIVRHGDAGALARALQELLSEGARQAARAAAPRLRKTLDWRPLARVQLDIYREVLRGSGRGRKSTRRASRPSFSADSEQAGVCENGDC